jgi:response regulator RpfG family c-di-GMP phosphodiesterase
MTKNQNSEKHFLIVDDLEHQRIAMKAAIQAVVPRSEFVEASNLDEALEIIKGKGDFIDLAVIDLKLTKEGQEGVEIIRTIRREYHRQKMRIILITAYPDAESQIVVEKAGADAYISKLSSSDTLELQEKVKQLLGV